MTIMRMSEAKLWAIREFPIECLIQKAARTIYKQLPEEPSRESLLTLKSLVVSAEKALEAIVEVDSKVRPRDEWMAALDVVEEIRDAAQEMIDLLEELV